jgi:glycosyltransferase involved in cell wall biosynthesis
LTQSTCFPEPLPDKREWPWRDSIHEMDWSFPPNITWPKITIITPSFQQGRYLEETIRSVLLQRYPNLEYFVIDGGSTDNSIEIIQKYSPWLSWWISEIDRGQADAINKGFQKSESSIIGWINSDDLLLPESLWHIALAHVDTPDKIIVGDVEEFSDPSSSVINKSNLVQQNELGFENFVEIWNGKLMWHQPGIFFPSNLLSRTGLLDTNLEYAFDHDFMCRLLQVASVKYLRHPVARFRLHDSSKTVQKAPDFLMELSLVIQRYWGLLPPDLKNHRKQALAALLCRYGYRYLRQSKIDGFRLMIEAFRISLLGAAVPFFEKIVRRKAI